MKCDTMECYSKAIAAAQRGGEIARHYCIECAIAVVKQWGPGCLKTIPGSKLPWEAETTGTCEKCGNTFSEYLIGLTGDCPKCRKTLPESKLQGWKDADIKYEEGVGHD